MISIRKSDLPSQATIEENATWLQDKLPYRGQPYSKRNWGHPLHSLCSYQGKLKPAIASWLVALFTHEGETVLDPLAGVGTIPFEASLQGRHGIANDLSPLAVAVSAGKLQFPSVNEFNAALTRLAEAIRTQEPDQADRESAEFGLNGSVADFYHPKTLREVLVARRYFLELNEQTPGDKLARAALLHVLHGNRPYALSRKSHPITPFHPSGATEYRSVVDRVERRVQRLLKTPLPQGFTPGEVLYGSFSELPNRLNLVDAIITSPPFLGMRFDRPNWLRLWFCGWGEQDFHTTSQAFLERKQKHSLEVYGEFFSVSRQLLKDGGRIILHIGGSAQHEMFETLRQLGQEYLTLKAVVDEDVSHTEKHGIQDKGLTTTHHYLVYQKA